MILLSCSSPRRFRCILACAALIFTGALHAAPPDAIPLQLSGRLTDISRQKLIQSGGGSAKTEAAVVAGLRWFKQHQNPDGSWSDKFPTAMTGLAMLSFLGHGELPDSPEFGASVKSGAQWLLKTGTELNGRMGTDKTGANLSTTAYEHAIATCAVAEYYALTHDQRFVELMHKMVAIIVAGQNAKGAWGYKYDLSASSDLSVSASQMQALYTAYITDPSLPGAPEALDRTIPFLSSWRGQEGGYGYTQPADKWSLTGAGVYGFKRWKDGIYPEIGDGVRFSLSKIDTQFPVAYDGEQADLYAWYYHTLAFHLCGGAPWTKWNSLLKKELTAHQNQDGAWPPCPGGPYLDDRDGIGPCYRTALCVLMLEVYYRYRHTSIPTY